MLSAKNLKQNRPNKKLSHKFLGPFRVEEILGKQAYRLILPTKFRIHLVFHVSLLEPYNRKEGDITIPEFTPPDLLPTGEEYEVEEILDRTKSKGEFWYFVTWKGWPEKYNQWVKEDNLGNSQLLLDEFVAKKSAKRKATTSKRGRRGRGGAATPTS